MSTQLTVKDMSPSLSLNQYFLEKIEGVLEKYGYEKQDYSLQVLVSEDSHRTTFRSPHFECRLVLKILRAKNPIIITQSENEFFKCAKFVEGVLEKKLRRLSSQKTARRKKRLSVVEAEPYFQSLLTPSA